MGKWLVNITVMLALAKHLAPLLPPAGMVAAGAKP